jgi:hypothetical protein
MYVSSVYLSCDGTDRAVIHLLKWLLNLLDSPVSQPPSTPTSTTNPNDTGNSRVRRVLAAAALAGVELDYDSSFSMKSDYKTEEFLKKNPVGYLPFLEDGDFSLAESSAIAEYGES